MKKTSSVKQTQSPCDVDTTRDLGLRKKLQGSALKKKTQRVKSRCQRSSLLYDKQEYHEEGDEYDVFEEMICELSLDTTASNDENYESPQNDMEDSSSCISYDLSRSFEEIPSLSSCSFEQISLDGTSSSPKNAACEDLLRALLDPKMPELFLRAVHTTTDWNCVPALNKFMHSGGDLHTSYNVILSWMKSRQTDKDTTIKEWSSDNYVHTGALKRVMHAIKKHSLDEVQQGLASLSDTICSMFKSQIAVFNGHIDEGFKRLSNGESIKCCTSSMIRLLDRVPKYVIYTPRHIHSDGHLCYHLTPVTEERVENITSTILTDFEEECSENMTTFTYDCTLGKSQRERFLATWPKNSLYVLKSFVNNTITLCIPSDEQERALNVLTEHIDYVKYSHVRKTEVYQYPPGTDTMSLTIGKGGTCDQVNNGVNVLHPTKRKIYEIRELVTVHVHLDISSSPFDDLAQLNQFCTTYMTDKFRDLHRNDFAVLSQPTSIYVKSVPVTIEFISHVTARRGLMFLAEDDSVSIVNQRDIDKDLKSYQVYIHKNLMAVIGDNVHKALRKMKNSRKFSAEYTMNIDENQSMVVFEISFKSRNVMDLDGLRSSLTPYILKLKNPTPMRQRLTDSTAGAPVLSMMSFITNTFMHIPLHMDEVHIYGTDWYYCRYASETVEDYLYAPAKTWKCIGRPKIDGAELPNGITYHTLKAILEANYVDIFDVVNVDYETKDFWILSRNNQNEIDGIIQDVKQALLDSLQEQFDMTVPLEFISFDIPKAVDFECGICFSKVLGKPYITEACGHIYCMECLRNQIKAVLSLGSLPITCGECETAFSVEDISYIMSILGVPRQRRLMKRSVDKYVNQFHGKKRFCPKPDCPGILDTDATTLPCAICGTKLCPDCMDVSHTGISCEQFQEYGKWMSVDPANRKKCPQCKMGIEKTGGCNHVICILCKSNLCWVCLEVFPSHRECYDHINERQHYF